jgi:hypothetical protein
MPVLITTDSGRSVDVADPANAQVVADSFDRLLKRANDAESKADKAQATADKAAEDLAEARKASSDEAIGERVKAISAQAQARKIAGDSFTCDSLDVIEIKRAAGRQASENGVGRQVCWLCRVRLRRRGRERA